MEYLAAMEHTLSIAGNQKTADFEQAVQVLQANGFTVLRQLAANRAAEMSGNGSAVEIEQYLADLQVDWCLHKTPVQIAEVLVCDMDSTIIGQECIDELAEMAGVGAQVKAITETAMQGGLEFSSSLTERVAQLAGLHEDVLRQCWNDRIRINPGARQLIATMNRLGAKTALVSGGFTWFADMVAKAVGFNEAYANQLVIKNHKLTGEVMEPILDGAAKRDHLFRLSRGRLRTCAIGDGANDLAMINAADIGISYRAKPIVERSANGRIKHTDLTTALLFQGIGPDQWQNDHEYAGLD